MAQYAIDKSLLGGSTASHYVVDPSLLGTKPKEGGGVLSSIKEAFTGPSGLKYQGARGLNETAFKLYPEEGVRLADRITFYRMFAKNQDEMASLLPKVFGPRLARIENDNGYLVAMLKDKDGKEIPAYINQPGLGMEDMDWTLAQMLPYALPAGAITRAGGGLLARLGLQAAGAGGTSLAQSAGVAMSGGSPTNPMREAAYAAAGGAAGEGLGSLFNVMLGRLHAARLVDANGRFTDKGRQVAKQIGIENPDTLTPESAQKFAELYTSIRKDMRVPDATGKSPLARKVEAEDLGIQGTTAQYTQNPADVEFTKSVLRGDFGIQPQNIMREAIPAEGETPAAIREGVSRQVLPATKKALGERVNAQYPVDSGEADAAAMTGLKTRLNEALAPAREIMPKSGEAVFVTEESMQPLINDLRMATLPKNGRVDDGITGMLHDVATKVHNGLPGDGNYDVQAYKILTDWVGGEMKAPHADIAANALAIRKELQILADKASAVAKQAGKPASKDEVYRRVAVMRDLLDKHLTRIAAKGAMTEPEARRWIDGVSLVNLVKWKRGMNEFRRIKEKFFERGKRDSAGRLLKRLADTDSLNPGVITSYITGRQRGVDRASFANRLKELLGENSDEWRLLKGHVLASLFTDNKGKPYQIRRVVEELRKLKTTGPWKEVFTPAERAQIDRFIKTVSGLNLSDSQARGLRENFLSSVMHRYMRGRAQGATTFQGKPVKGTLYRKMAQFMAKGILGRMTGGLLVPTKTTRRFASGWLPPATGGAVNVTVPAMAQQPVGQAVVSGIGAIPGALVPLMQFMGGGDARK